MASEAFKIKIAQLKMLGNDFETHVLVYDELLNQLKHDFDEKWLFGWQDNSHAATDLKKYLDDFAKIHRLKPDEKSQLEDYSSTQGDFRETMIFIAKKLNESGKSHIILMDEVDLNNVVASVKSKENLTYLDIDLSYLAEFENVRFILCLRPTIDGYKNFQIEYSEAKPNQYIKQFMNRYRNCKPIYDLLNFWQKNDVQSDYGFPMITNRREKLDERSLPTLTRFKFFLFF